MDRQIAPLNPCSVETIPEPIRLADGRMVWPWMLSCYELDETSGKRFGQIELGVIDVPDIANHSNAMPLKFDKTERAMKETGKIQLLDLSERRSGVLDGKWSAMPPPSTNDLTEENVQSTSSCTGWCFASAHSTGEIRIHSVQLNNTTGSQDFDNAHDRNPLSSPEPLFSVNFLGQSEIMHTMSTEESSKLCLSLCWNNPAAYKQNHEQPTPNQSHPQLVSTYSNGRIAIHDVVFASDNSSVHMIEREAWLAHTMFSTTPSEVWSSCFAAGEQQLILSGGDDGKLKIWDVRATGRPIQVLDELFTSGVTCLSPHPVQEHIIAAGSCKFS